MKKGFCPVLAVLLLFYTAASAQSSSPLTISEVMFYPSEKNGEFIEIYNTSSVESIDLTGYKIKYYNSAANNFTGLRAAMVLAPNSFAVILQGNYDFNNGFYKSIIPAGALILKLSTNNFGSSGMANTTGREVSLINPANAVVESYTYSADNSAGISDEKIILQKDNSASNWRNSLSKNGTPGARNSVSPFDFDLAVSFGEFTPSKPAAGDTLKFGLIIKNMGLRPASAFSVFLFNDANNDSSGQSNELIASAQSSGLPENDSLVIIEKIYLTVPGSCSLVATLNFDKDENGANNSAILKFPVVEKPASYNEVVLNELMYAPSTGEPEWVELYNNSNRAININGWRLGNNSSIVTITSKDIFLDQGGYLVLSSDSSILNIHKLIPTLLIKKLPSLRNSGGEVRLKNNRDGTVDSIEYQPSWGGSNGRSLERINPGKQTNDRSNWKSCVSEFKSTPGFINSVSAKKYDACIKSFIPLMSWGEPGIQVKATVRVENSGSETVDNYTLKIFRDADLNGVPDAGELEAAVEGINLAPGKSRDFEFSLSGIAAGKNQFIALLEYAPDQYNDNNRSILTVEGIILNERRGDVVLNEIMYAPDNEEPEWIELFNISNKLIELKGYQIGDGNSENKVVKKSFTLHPKDYLVIAKDSSLLSRYGMIPELITAPFESLNNISGNIIVLDSLNRIIDSVNYRSVWGGGGGKSLEKINSPGLSNDPKNWGTSKSRRNGTPGIINSLSQKNTDLGVTGFSSESGYAEAGKAVHLTVTVSNLGLNNSGPFTLSIYNDLNFDMIGNQQEFITSFRNAGLAPGTRCSFTAAADNCRKGKNQYLAVIGSADDEYPDNNLSVLQIEGAVLNEKRGDLIVNEIMYAPAVNEPEWLEFYNRSGKSIDLKGYRIRTGSNDAKLFPEDFMINPDEYVVAAKDSNFFRLYGKIPKTVIGKFGDLNNGGGSIMLIDSLGRTIDSVFYNSKWGGSGGRSLERIDPARESDDASNWGSCVDPGKGTPGRINSLSKKEYDISMNKLISDPARPILNGKVYLKAEISNTGNLSSRFTIKLFELTGGAKSILEESKEETLSAGTSLEYRFGFFVESLKTERKFEAEINCSADQDSANNWADLTLVPGIPPRSIVINEIMYKPSNGEPEWIELFNNSEEKINLAGWSIGDLLAVPVKSKISTGDSFLNPYTYIVLAKDSISEPGHSPIPSKQIVLNLPVLNNDKDGIVIYDRDGAAIDSVFYYSSWGGSDGSSLERVSFSGSSTDEGNWSPSIDPTHATPGRINSVSPKQYDLILKSLSTIPEFPALSENIKLKASIYNAGSGNAANFSVIFYLRSNNETEYFDVAAMNNLASKDSATVITQKSFPASAAITALCRIKFASDEDSVNNYRAINIVPGAKRGSVVINEFMYDPLAGESQWVEIFNCSASPVNLKNWSVGDLIPAQVKGAITAADSFLDSGEYAVIARDTSHYQYNPPPKYFEVKFGSLNKSGDGIILRDLRGAVEDSLRYNQNWGGSGGISLERLSAEGLSTDSTNWAPSIEAGGATPGYRNSVTGAKHYTSGSLVINEIMYDPASGNSNYIEIYNPQSDSIQLGGLQVKLGTNASFKITDASRKLGPKAYYLIASDSLLINIYQWLKGEREIYVPRGGFRLLNQGEPVALRDLFGNVVDSVFFLPSWHNKNFSNLKNRSLERLNPLLGSNDKSNWSTCAAREGGTPGKINSLYTENVARVPGVNISPNPFSPDNDGFEDFTFINLNLDKPLSQIRIRVYDSTGRLMRTLINNAPSVSKNTVIFDGRDDSGKALRIGIYIVLIEAAGTGSGTVQTFKVPLVVARKL
jgi:Lamin Tail Domain